MKIKKLIALLTVFIMTFSSIPVSAISITSEGEIQPDTAFIIEVDTLEEYYSVLNAIEKENQRVESLWQAALEQSMNTKSAPSNTISPRGVFTTSPVAYKYHAYGNLGINLGLYVVYDKVTSGNGSYYTFGQIHAIHLTTQAGNPINNKTFKHVKIDGERVLAVNYSCEVGIKLIDTYTYRIASGYVEFNANGTYIVY